MTFRKYLSINMGKIAFLIVIGCFLSACQGKYVDIQVNSWSYVEETTDSFVLKNVNGSIIWDHGGFEKGTYKEVKFSVNNETAFLEEIQKNPAFTHQEQTKNGLDVYVFSQYGHWYYLINHGAEDKSKKTIFTLQNAYSSILDAENGICYWFPLVDMGVSYNGKFLFSTKDAMSLETTLDWNALRGFYESMDERECVIDEENKTIKIKAIAAVQGSREFLEFTDGYVVQLEYHGNKEMNVLCASLKLENADSSCCDQD